jgi:ABC-type molybdate transport system substrate-binding protein
MKNSFWLAAGVTLLVMIGSIVAFRASTVQQEGNRPSESDEPLVMYCAAGIMPPVQAAVKQYEQEYGVKVQLDPGGSGDLLARIDTARRGDLYLAADDGYIEIARQKGLAAESLPLARLRVVIGVPRGNPKQIASLESLLEGELRIGFANPDAAAVGKISRTILQRAGLWEPMKQAIETRGVFKPTVTDLANDLKLGAVDAALVWDATVNQYPELEAVAIDDAVDEPQDITVGVLSFCRQPTRALHFARYLAARDKGLVHFKQNFYEPVAGDKWADRPELTLFIGGMLRPAVEQTLEEFKAREGVDVRTEYNGCGILVASMKTTQQQGGRLPDAYFACDTSFMTQVAEVFPGAKDMSRTKMVICVQKGNPHEIRELADLGKPNLQVGVCNAEQSALGALTKTLLETTGTYESVMKNVVVQVPTADLLVAQLRAGGLDAAIVYEVNYRNSLRQAEAEKLARSGIRENSASAEGEDPAPSAGTQIEAIEIAHPRTTAVQPLGVWKDSDNKHLVGRLIAALRAAEAKQRFTTRGFAWLADEPAGAGSP